MPTELDDLERPLRLPAGVLELDREARIFARRRDLVPLMREQALVVRLVPDELLHPEPPCDLVVRRGNLRVSELLQDGREATRAVLQTGGVCRVRRSASPPQADQPSSGDQPSSPLYTLATTVMMALGETEIWQLPAGSLDPDRTSRETAP
jgi:hypothetical protein